MWRSIRTANRGRWVRRMAKVGIFWVYKGKVIGRAISLDQGVASGDWIDSPDEHVTQWEREPAFSSLRKIGDGYESVPRGRVVWFEQGKKSVIYMDKKLLTSDASKKKVAEFFDLDPATVQWKSDPHYTTDPTEIAKLFDA